MIAAAMVTTFDKAQELNLDPAIYGTFAEIGAGQETANWFFRASGSAGIGVSSRSTSVTWCPTRAKASADPRPPMPAPTTTMRCDPLTTGHPASTGRAGPAARAGGIFPTPVPRPGTASVMIRSACVAWRLCASTARSAP